MKSVAQEFPYPIAANVDRLLEERKRDPRSYTIEFFALIDVFESLLKYLCLISISNYIERGPGDQRIDEIINQRFLGRPLSLGGWESLLQTLLRYYRQNRDDFFMPPLIDFYYRSGGRSKMTREARQFREFISIRNAKLAHGGLKSEEEYQLLLEEREPIMEDILDKLAFLADYPLYIPTGQSSQVIHCKGLAFEIIDRPPSSPPEGGREDSPLLFDGDGGCLQLYPLLFPDIGGDAGRDDLFFYDKNRRKSRNSEDIQTLEFLGVRHKRHLKIRPGDSYSPILKGFSHYLADWLSRAEELVELEVPSYAYRELEALLREYASPFYGRESLVQEIWGEVGRGKGGYLFISGEGGSGKTALLAHLARGLNHSVYHFLAQGTNDVTRWIQSLMEQLLQLSSDQSPVPTDRDVLLREFWSRAAQLAEVEPLVIVLDALDELEERDANSLFFLPSQLPPGLFVILSSRLGTVRERIRTRLDVREFPLERLSTSVVKSWWKETLDDKPKDREVSRLMNASQGNPLYIKFFFQARKRGAQIELTRGLDDLFEEALKTVLDGEKRDVATEILGLLTASRGGFTRRDLSEISGQSQLEVGAVLDRFQDFTVERDETYDLFHRRFREFCRDSIFTSEELGRYHKKIGRYFREWAEDPREYGLSHLAYHLSSAGDDQGLVDLVRSDFPRQKGDFFSDPLASEDDLDLALAAGSRLKNPLVMLEFAAEKAFLFRAVQRLAESGLLALYTRLGEVGSALHLAARLGSPEDRYLGLHQIASEVVERHPEFAEALISEIQPFSLRAQVAVDLGAKYQRDPIRFLDPIINHLEWDELESEERESLLARAIPLLADLRPGWALRLLQNLESPLEAARAAANSGSLFLQGELASDYEKWLMGQLESPRDPIAPDWARAAAVVAPRRGVEWAEQIEDEDLRHQALSQVGIYLVRQDRRRQGEKMPASISPGPHRDRLLAELSFHLPDDLERAGGWIDEITSPATRCRTRARLMALSQEESLLEEAMADLEKIEAGIDRELVRADVALALGKISPTKGTDLIRTIDIESVRIGALRDLGLELAHRSPHLARELLALAARQVVLSGDRSGRARIYATLGEVLPSSEDRRAVDLLKRSHSLVQTEPEGRRRALVQELIGHLALRNLDEAASLIDELPLPLQVRTLAEGAEKLWRDRRKEAQKWLEKARDKVESLEDKAAANRGWALILPLSARLDQDRAWDDWKKMEDSATAHETAGKILAETSREDLEKSVQWLEEIPSPSGKITAGAALSLALAEEHLDKAREILDRLLSLARETEEFSAKVEALSRLQKVAAKVDSIRSAEIVEELDKLLQDEDETAEDRAQAERMVAVRREDDVEEGLEHLDRAVRLDVSYRGVRDSRERAIRLLLQKPYRERWERAVVLSREIEDGLLPLLPNFIRTLARLCPEGGPVLVDLQGYLEEASRRAAVILAGVVDELEEEQELVPSPVKHLSHREVDGAIEEEGKADPDAPVPPDEDLLAIKVDLGEGGEDDVERLIEIVAGRGDRRREIELWKILAQIRREKKDDEGEKKCYQAVLAIDPEDRESREKLDREEIPEEVAEADQDDRVEEQPAPPEEKEAPVAAKAKPRPVEKKPGTPPPTPKSEITRRYPRRDDQYQKTIKDLTLTFQLRNLTPQLAVLVLRLDGKLYLENANTFSKKLEIYLSHRNFYLALDMGGLTKVDSTGLGILVKLADQVKQTGGMLALFRVPEEVRGALEALGLQAFFPIWTNLGAALDGLRGNISSSPAKAGGPTKSLSSREEQPPQRKIDSKKKRSEKKKSKKKDEKVSSRGVERRKQLGDLAATYPPQKPSKKKKGKRGKKKRDKIPDKIGEYEVIKPLGQGGRGQVLLIRDDEGDLWQARAVLQPSLEQEEKWKRWRKDMDSLPADQFLRLGKIVAADNQKYLVVEHYPGLTLQQLMRREGPLGPEKVQNLMKLALQALAVLHRRGMVFGDLRPQTIYVSPDEKSIKIDTAELAIQVAQGDKRSLTKAGGVIGNPLYMSPEQVRGDKRIDLRSDLYGVAILAYEMLTGKVPFGDKNKGPADNIRAKLTEAPPSVRQDAAQPLALEAEEVLNIALSKDPNQRFQSADDFIFALKGLTAPPLDKTANVIPQEPAAAPRPHNLRHAQAMPAAGRAKGGYPLTLVLFAIFVIVAIVILLMYLFGG